MSKNPLSEFPVPILFPFRTCHEVCENDNHLTSLTSLDQARKVGIHETKQLHESPSGFHLMPIRESHRLSGSSLEPSTLPADRPPLSEQPNLELTIAAPSPLDQSKQSPTSLMIGPIRVI